MAEWTGMRLARARLVVGVLLSDFGKAECAAEVLRAGLAYDPDMVEAHVALGLAYGRQTQYEEMIGSFVRAISLDRRKAGEALCEEPEEVRLIKDILYGPAETGEVGPHPAMPAEVREASELVGEACERIRRGGGEAEAAAVEMLERAVRLDPASSDPTTVLAFAYLLLGYEQRSAWAVKSALWEASPWLARLFFVGAKGSN